MIENNKGIYLKIVIAVVITVLVTLGIVYLVFLRKPDEKNNIESPLTDEEALIIVKDVLRRANNFINVDDVNTDDCYDNQTSDYCFYKTRSELEKEVNNLFMNTITLDNIIYKYGNDDTNKESFTSYREKDNKIYLLYMCNANSIDKEITDYTIINKSINEISVKYKIHNTYEGFAFTKEGMKEEQIKSEYQEYLNEIPWSSISISPDNGKWKINKVTMLNICNSEFTIDSFK